MRLLVIPSEAPCVYERRGYGGWLRDYYNPCGLFDEVYAFCPDEPVDRDAHGMHILSRRRKDYGATVRGICPDIVRAYGGYWPADLACAGRASGIRVVVSVHDTNPNLLFGSIRYADAVICISNAVAERVRKKGVPPDRIRMLPNRVDRTVFKPLPPDHPEVTALRKRFGGGRFILHVGRHTAQKNVDTLLRALALLPADYQCVLIGAPHPSPYARLAAQLGVAPRCHWVESVQNDELPAWYSWCDVMCTPSRWEGFGIVFIEAAASGAAVITTDRAPMNEYLEHGRTAHLVRDEENPQSIAAAIRDVVENTGYRQALRAAAPGASEPFDAVEVSRREAALYRDVLARPVRVLQPTEMIFLNSGVLWRRALERAAMSRGRLATTIRRTSGR